MHSMVMRNLSRTVVLSSIGNRKAANFYFKRNFSLKLLDGSLSLYSCSYYNRFILIKTMILKPGQEPE